MTDSQVLEWLDKQTQMRVEIFIRTALTGPKVRIFYGHRLIGSGETIKEAVEKAASS